MKQLTQEQKKILEEKGTEPPFSGELLYNKKTGVYKCAQCENPLFHSDTKFDSGSGWPSFYDVIAEGNVKIKEDQSHGMKRNEVACAKCGGHLGHVFDDGPTDKTGLRYCVNSGALEFEEDA